MDADRAVVALHGKGLESLIMEAADAVGVAAYEKQGWAWAGGVRFFLLQAAHQPRYSPWFLAQAYGAAADHGWNPLCGLVLNLAMLGDAVPPLLLGGRDDPALINQVYSLIDDLGASRQ